MTNASDGSRLFSFRLSGELRAWLEEKAKHEGKNITDVITESLRFQYVKDSILRHLKESTQRNRPLAELFETNMDDRSFRQLYDFADDQATQMDSRAVLSYELIERHSQNRVVVIKYDDLLGQFLDKTLQSYALRYFREWLTYEARSIGEEYLRISVYGREFVFVNVERCTLFGPTAIMVGKESAKIELAKWGLQVDE